MEIDFNRNLTDEKTQIEFEAHKLRYEIYLKEYNKMIENDSHRSMQQIDRS